MIVPAEKKKLIDWYVCFFISNCLLFWLIGLCYFSSLSWLDVDYIGKRAEHVIELFVMLTYCGQIGLFAALPCLLVAPLLLFFPKKNVIFFFAIFFSTLVALFLAVDALTYKLYRFHLNRVMIEIIFNGLFKEILGLSWVEKLSCVLAVIGFSSIQFFVSIIHWRYHFFRFFFKWFLILIAMSLFSSYCMIIYSNGFKLNRVLIDVSRVFPFYNEIFLFLLPKGAANVITHVSEPYLIQPSRINKPLNYPLATLQFSKVNQFKNILIIGLDAWRFDMMNAEVTPHIFKIAQESTVFTNHFSGGNATGPGIFSLFYSLPESYWDAMESQRRAPVLMEELKKRHYQMGIFTSATLRLPPFQHTVFLGIDSLVLDTEGKNCYEKDKKITQEFKEFIAKASSKPQPFFSFLFYDSSHSYCSFENKETPFLPIVKQCNRLELNKYSNATPYLNRYKNAVYFIDTQIKEIWETLKEYQLLENTVIILTGDHGEEFNDNHQGYWSHASNFTRYQTQTPLVVYWPSQKASVFNHQTSHYDVVPTLMEQILGCQTEPTRYSLGHSLFDATPRPYLIMSSYIDWGILTPTRIIQATNLGSFRVQNLNAEVLLHEKPDIALIKNGFKDMNQFYK